MSYNNPTSQGINLIKKISGIDLKTTGTTYLYTVPIGKSLMITNFLIVATDVTGYTDKATVTAGTVVDAYQDWADITDIPVINSNGNTFDLAKTNDPHIILTSDTDFYLQVTNAISAVTGTCDIYLFGIFI